MVKSKLYKVAVPGPINFLIAKNSPLPIQRENSADKYATRKYGIRYALVSIRYSEELIGFGIYDMNKGQAKTEKACGKRK